MEIHPYIFILIYIFYIFFYTFHLYYIFFLIYNIYKKIFLVHFLVHFLIIVEMFGFEPKIQQSKCCVLTNYTTFQFFLRRTVGSNHIQFYPDAQLSRLPLSPFSIILHFVPRTRLELVQTMRSKGFSYHYSFHYQ